jgi:hypothetical protein
LLRDTEEERDRQNKNRKMGKEDRKRTWSSEHCPNNTTVMSAEERRVANMNAREILTGLLAQITDIKSKDEEQVIVQGRVQ